MNIILIGYRGTGKSVVAKILAEKLNMAVVGMDDEIVRHAGMSIPEVVEKFGWDHFRDIETRIALALAEKDNLIIDTGGGVIERPENMRALEKTGPVFWLTASVDTIVDRIKDDTNRPALVDGKTFTEEIAEVLEKRESRYRGAAQHEIDTDSYSPDQVADRVLACLDKAKI